MRATVLKASSDHQLIQIRWVLVMTLTLLFTLLCGISLVGQQLRTQDLPGREFVDYATRVLDDTRPSESIRDLYWDEQAGILYFTRLGSGSDNERERLQITLANGECTAAEDKSNRDAESTAPQRREPRVGRAQQRTSLDSPDGNWRAVYRNFNVTLEPVEQSDDALPIQVTTRGDGKFRYGTACWVYGEELDQNDAMWFSPDSKKLAFYEIDERHMQTYYLTHGNTDDYTRLHTEQYPKAGSPNPHVRLMLYDIATRTTTPVETEGPKDTYVYNIRFSPKGDELIFSRTNRWQNRLDVMAADAETGATRIIVSEEQATWQRNRPMMRFLADGERFIWETERTGWKHFELRHIDGQQLNPLTDIGDYPCERVLEVDEAAGWMYYSAFSDDHPLNSQLHRVALDGNAHSKLTQGPFTYQFNGVSPDHQYFVCRFEAIDHPPVYALFDMEGNEISKLAHNSREAAAAAGVEPAELFSFLANDGTTLIYGTLQKPIHFDSSKKYPLLISVYGGPASTGVTNRYSHGDSLCQYGFLVAKIGNRGTVNRGKDFESANYLQLGIVDMDDQADGVAYLAQREYIDESRVGIFGTSYGGYLSALALLRYPDRFHVAVAGAPVTDWKNYDTIYTERYMKTPQENPDGYRIGSCLEYIDNLQGKLLLMHGLVDDNVHPSNVWQLADRLQVAGKRFDMMIYPNSAHGGFTNSQALRMDYFIRHLEATPVPLPIPVDSTASSGNDSRE